MDNEPRSSSGLSHTQYQYTGQYSHTADFGLMFYCEASLWDNARWYDPALGRFAQADFIAPPGVQGLDRYAYVNNNPIRYNDPTGHMCMDPEANRGAAGCDGADKVGTRSLRGERPRPSICRNCHTIPSATPTSIPTGTPTIPPELLSTPTPCRAPGSACVPTATNTPTPYIGPVITSPTQPSPQMEIYVDWAKVDMIDFGIDVIGLGADGIALASMIPPLTPVLGPVVPFAEIGGTLAEGAGFVKSGIELIQGDPTSMFVQQTTGTGRVVAMGFRLERMTPGIGFVGNLVSLYINLKPQIRVTP